MHRNFIVFLAVIWYLQSIASEPVDKDLRELGDLLKVRMRARAEYNECEKDRKANDPWVLNLHNLYRTKAREYLKTVEQCNLKDEAPTETTASQKLGDDLQSLKILVERASNGSRQKYKKCLDLYYNYAEATLDWKMRDVNIALKRGENYTAAKKREEYGNLEQIFDKKLENPDSEFKPWFLQLPDWEYEAPAVSKCTAPQDDYEDSAQLLSRENKVLDLIDNEASKAETEAMAYIEKATRDHGEYCYVIKTLPQVFADCDEAQEKMWEEIRVYDTIKDDKSVSATNVNIALQKIRDAKSDAEKLHKVAHDGSSIVENLYKTFSKGAVTVDGKIRIYRNILKERNTTRDIVKKLDPKHSDTNNDKEANRLKSMMKWRNRLEGCVNFLLTGLCPDIDYTVDDDRLLPRVLHPKVVVPPVTTTGSGKNITPSLFAILALLVGISTIVF